MVEITEEDIKNFSSRTLNAKTKQETLEARKEMTIKFFLGDDEEAFRNQDIMDDFYSKNPKLQDDEYNHLVTLGVNNLDIYIQNDEIQKFRLQQGGN